MQRTSKSSNFDADYADCSETAGQIKGESLKREQTASLAGN